MTEDDKVAAFRIKWHLDIGQAAYKHWSELDDTDKKNWRKQYLHSTKETDIPRTDIVDAYVTLMGQDEMEDLLCHYILNDEDGVSTGEMERALVRHAISWAAEYER